MIRRVLVVGAGQLGSRYLQGLKATVGGLEVHVVDGHALSVERARARWEEAPATEGKKSVNWHQGLVGIQGEFDLAIVATPADVRADVVESVLKHAAVRYWMLEKVLVQSVQDLRRLRAAIAGAQAAWVNTPRRVMPLYRALAVRLRAPVQLEATLHGGAWGMACNAVHYLDLLAWLSGEQLSELDTRGLSGKWYPSKRPGFFETDGTLIAKYQGGTQLTLMSSPLVKQHLLILRNVEGDDWTIDESAGTANGPGGDVIRGSMLMQSALTPALCASVFETGTCQLPTLNESLAIHEIFLEALLANWNASEKRHDARLPIT